MRPSWMTNLPIVHSEFYIQRSLVGYNLEMRHRILIKLMTLVLLLSSTNLRAVPPEEADLFADEKQSIAVPETQNVQEELDDKGIIVTAPPKASIAKNELIYPYKQTMSPRAGLILDPDQLKDGELPLLVGITYMWPRNKSPRWELGFDILLDGGAHVSIGKRFIWSEPHSFRPFLKLGGLLAAQAEEKLATVSDFDNYYATGSVGFEDVLKMPMSVRLEMQLVAGLENQFLIFNFGYSWGW